MKKLFGLCLLIFPVLAFADLNPDQASDILANALKIAAGIPGIVGAIFASVFIGIYGIIALSKAISSISEYFKSRQQREEDAYKETQAAKLRQMADQQKRERENYDAYKSIIETAWQIKLDKITELLKADTSKDVLLMVPDALKLQASDIIYNSARSPEARAFDIIRLIRK